MIALELGRFGVAVAFVAGLVSFLSPCVFPLVPGYLSYLAGVGAGEVTTPTEARWQVTLHAIFFVLGFALIFSVLGAGASAFGALLLQHRLLLRHAFGVLLVLFGVVMTGLVPLPWLQRERRAQLARGEPALLRSALIGVAFGAGWSPCIGPALGTILGLAAATATLAQGVGLLLIYALGLGVPFVLVALLIDRAAPVVRSLNRYTGPISVASGVVLAATGVLIFSGTLERLASYAPLIPL